MHTLEVYLLKCYMYHLPSLYYKDQLHIFYSRKMLGIIRLYSVDTFNFVTLLRILILNLWQFCSQFVVGRGFDMDIWGVWIQHVKYLWSALTLPVLTRIPFSFQLWPHPCENWTHGRFRYVFSRLSFDSFLSFYLSKLK